MKVDQHIVRAINQYLAANRTTQKELCAHLEISESSMVKWKKHGGGIADNNWSKLYVLIKRYLPKDRIYISSAGVEEYSSLNEGRPQSDHAVCVPLLNSSDLLKYNPIVGIEQYAQTEKLRRIEYKPKVKGISGMFCYKLETASEGIPEDASLFVSSEAKPRNDGLVLAVTSEGEILLGYFRTTGGAFEFSAGGKNRAGKLDEIRQIFAGIYPVISYEVVCYN